MPSATFVSTRQPRRIDFSLYVNGSPEQKVRVARELTESIHETGFCRLVSHNVPRTVLDLVFKQTTSFFKLPTDVKSRIKHPPAFNPHRGWSEVGRETVSTVTDYEKGVTRGQKVVFDVKEAFDMGNPDDELFANVWLPNEDLPGFQHNMEQFYDECRKQHLMLLEALELGCQTLLGIDVDFQSCCSQSVSECRVNWYPATPASLLRAGGKCNRISPHTDFGTLTLLFQDQVGGLEIEDQSNFGIFFPVSCDSPYEMLVNAGDVLQRWSNDYFRSVNHKVTLPMSMKTREGDVEGKLEDAGIAPARRSVAFFAKADRDVDVGSFHEFLGEGDVANEKYEHITALEYNQIKLKLTYGTSPPDATDILAQLQG